MTEKDVFSWLELKPQQNFKDDKENKILDIISHSQEFAFFVIRKNGIMRIVARTTERDEDLFRTIAGITAERSSAPQFGNMVAKRITFAGKRLSEPIVDLKAVTKSGMYQKIWKEKQDSMMACFAYNSTKQVRDKIDRKISTLEMAEKAGGASLSSRKKRELEWLKQKRQGNHGYYNCCLVFGIETANDQQDKEEIRHSNKLLDNLIGRILANSFADRIARRRIRFSAENGLWKKTCVMLGIFSMIDPNTFVPKSMRQKMVLTETELAYFVSFPEEHDVQTINFEMGPTPTFVHGKTEKIADA